MEHLHGIAVVTERINFYLGCSMPNEDTLTRSRLSLTIRPAPKTFKIKLKLREFMFCLSSFAFLQQLQEIPV